MALCELPSPIASSNREFVHIYISGSDAPIWKFTDIPINDIQGPTPITDILFRFIRNSQENPS